MAGTSEATLIDAAYTRTCSTLKCLHVPALLSISTVTTENSKLPDFFLGREKISLGAMSSIITRLQNSPHTLVWGLGGLFSIVSFVGLNHCLDYCRRFRQQAEDAEHEHRRLRSRLDATEEEAQTLKASLLSAKDELKLKENNLKKLGQDILQVKAESVEVTRMLERARVQIAGLERRLQTETEMAAKELLKMKESHVEVKELLKTRTEELKGAQLFLAKTDEHAGGDIIGMVEGLNAEIMQTAALMAEAFEFQEQFSMMSAPPSPSSDIQHTKELIIEFLGSRMTELLYSNTHHEDPFLLQMAFQAGMCAFTEWMISSWCFEEREREHLLTVIYESLRQSEDQPVAGRWRALTRKYVQQLRGDPVSSTWPIFLSMFINILLVAGINSTPEQLETAIVQRFSEKIDSLLRLSVKINRAVGEGVTSCEMIVVYVLPGTPFEADEMEDGWGGRRQDENILCTTDLGLLRAVRNPVTEQGLSWDETLLLKPRVALESALYESSPDH